MAEVGGSAHRINHEDTEARRVSPIRCAEPAWDLSSPCLNVLSTAAPRGGASHAGSAQRTEWEPEQEEAENATGGLAFGTHCLRLLPSALPPQRRREFGGGSLE